MGAISFSIDPGLLRFLAGQLQTEVFVETGTFEGESLAIAAATVPECHSVELSPEYYSAACRRFRDRDRVHLVEGDSVEFLRDLTPRLAGRAILYWLDAHWCVADNTAGADSQSPVLGEIEAIGRLGDRSVLCIDDARLYLCPPPAPHRYADWPDFQSLLHAIQACAPGHHIMVFNDVFVVYPQLIESQLRAYAFEHGVDWLHLANLVLRPGNDAPRPSKRRSRLRRFFGI